MRLIAIIILLCANQFVYEMYNIVIIPLEESALSKWFVMLLIAYAATLDILKK